jgi:hypothetical protein
MPISLNGDGIISGVTTFTTAVTGVTTFTTVNATNLSVSGIATVAAGSTSAPSITTSGDNNTGLFFPSADTISFATGGTERGRWISGGGLTFNGDTAAANALDDYEEGTWTPTDISGAGLTLTVGYARYTKIGRLVYLQAYITYPSTASSSVAAIGPVPFTPSSGTAPTGSAFGDALFNIVPYLNQNTTQRFFKGGANQNMVNSELSSKYLFYTLVYEV